MHSMIWMRLLVAAGSALALAACGKEGGQAQGPVVLKVNERSYTAADLEREITQELRRAPREMQQLLASKDGQKQFLDRLVRRELLLQEAETRKIGDEFSGESIRARHILVKTEEEAKQILERLAKKEPFEELARTLSKDSGTASKGGDLEYFRREEMLPEFAKAAFALKPGEVSGAVKTPFGYHIIKLVDRKKGQPTTYEQVKEQLRRRLFDERQNQRFQEWIKGLESAAQIIRDDSLLPVGKPMPGIPGPSGAPAGDGKGGGKL
ncbi:MAG: peptidylprolyl isomerase [candidate division NC10 bacterium]|nr:peptidylprolyl isomerase [candidate division NC10 bacterium]